MKVRLYSETSQGGIQLREALAPIDSSLVLNWGYKLHNNYDQLLQFQANEIPTIVSTINLIRATKWHQQGFVVWGRKLNHTKGKDIVPYNNPFWVTRDYWIKVVPNVVTEYRVHVFDGKHIWQGKKVHKADTANTNSIVMRRGLGELVRNRLTGWRMVHNFRLPSKVRELAIQAVASLGYLYGAVDLIVDDRGDMFVLECNSAAGMDDSTLNAYVEAITQWATQQS